MINVIPAPYKVIEKEGIAVFSKGVKAIFAKEFTLCKDYFMRTTANVLIGGIEITNKESEAGIRFLLSSGMDSEEYTIEITSVGIIVRASGDVGALYALMSLNQLLEVYSRKAEDKIEVPIVTIIDRPRYKWRGILLDVSRHFFAKADVKKIMDEMLLHKLNVLHLHLTDDQGWRIEIKKYPLLTEIGSRRKWSQLHGWNSIDPEKDIDKREHSGYYTQEDIKELVKYASDRGIMVVPEIDMPGHFRAAMAGYPELQCDETKHRDVPWYFGSGFAPLDGGAVSDAYVIACAGKESTYEFIEDILSEVTPLFPAPYFHIGGDEAPKNEWKTCPHCQAKIKEQGLRDEEELQGYFNNRVVEMLKKYNKRLIVWNEALEGGNLDTSTIGQYWTPTRDKNAEEYANKKGGSLILSKHSAFYFDMCYGQVPLQATYHFEAGNVGIDSIGEKNVMGVEGTLWTEWIADMDKLEFNSHPRFAALSESAWSEPQNKDFGEFVLRLENMKKIYDALGIKYACNKVAIVRNPIRRLKEFRIWNKGGDQHHEMKEDIRFRTKGAK